MLTKRQKQYRKAHNIKQNNLKARYKGMPMSREILPLIIKKYSDYQSFLRRQRSRALAKAQVFNKRVVQQQKALKASLREARKQA